MLGGTGVIWIKGPFVQIDDVWSEARRVVDRVTAGEAPLAILGDFVIPQPGGPPSRDFQTLHFDFGPAARPSSADRRGPSHRPAYTGRDGGK